MKKILIIFFISFQINYCFSQKIKFGTYISNTGSYFTIKHNGTFDYQKAHNLKLDVNIVELNEISKGSYKLKNNLLLINSSKSFIDSIINKSIIISEKESINQIKDSIKIYVKKNDNFLVYICGTGLEMNNNPNDSSSSFLIENEKILNRYNNFQQFSIKIYLDFNNNYFRSYPNFKNYCFESEKYSKKYSKNDIYITVDFDILNFYFVELKDEIVLVKKDRLFYKGEEFIFKN